MSSYRVIIKGARGKQVFVRGADSKLEAAEKAAAHGIAPDEIEGFERTTCDPEQIDTGSKDGHGSSGCMVPAIPWHRCNICGRSGHRERACSHR